MGKFQPKDISFLNKMREAAKNAEPLLKRCMLSQLHIDADGLSKQYVELSGMKIPVTTSFFNKLLRFLNINAKLASNFTANNDTQIVAKLVEAMKSYQTKKVKDTEIYLIADRVARTVYDFCPVEKYNRISSDVTFDLAERILNDVPSLGVQSVDIYGGEVKLNLLSTDQIDFSKVGRDEEFHMGFSLVTAPTSSHIDNYIWRLVCSNGMGGPEPKGGPVNPDNDGGGVGGPTPLSKLPINGSDDSFYQILQRIREMEKTGFTPQNFNRQLELAAGTRASLHEVEKAMFTITDRINEQDPDRKKLIVDAFKRDEFPLYGETLHRLGRKGIEYGSLSTDQKKFIKTGMTVWDVVNQLTWHGSHVSNGFEITDNAALKYEGGQLFAKNYDLANAHLINA